MIMVMFAADRNREIVSKGIDDDDNRFIESFGMPASG